MSAKKTIKLSHKDLVKIIEKQSNDAREQALEKKRSVLRKGLKKAQKETKKPIVVVKQTFETEKQIIRDKRRKGVSMISIIKETIELTKEFVLLRSPMEVYIFVGGVWLTGVGIGALLG